MTPPSTGKSAAVRVGVILFSACMMGGFVWYSHVRAQPKSGVVAAGEPTPSTILPGSKRANVTVTVNDVGRLREDGTIDLNLDGAAGQYGTPAKSEESMILPSSKLGVFRDIAGNASTSSGTGDGKLEPLPASGSPPTQPVRPVMFSGSKVFAGPVVTVDQVAAITLGNGSKEASQLSLQGQIPVNQPPPPSRVMMMGSKSMPTPPISSEGVMKLTEINGLPPVQLPGVKSPDPEWNKDAPIFTSSKSGPIFKPALPPATPPAPNQPPATNAPLPEKKVKAETGTQSQTDSPAPVSP